MKQRAVPERSRIRSASRTVLLRPAMLLELDQLIEGSTKVAVIAIAAVAILTAAELASYVAAPVVAGVLLGMTIGPQIDWLERRGIPPIISSGAFVVTLVLMVGLALWFVAAPLETWTSRISEITDKFKTELTTVQQPLERLQEVENEVEKAASESGADERQKPVEVVVKKSGIVTDLISAAPEIAARVIIFIGTLFFFAATRSSLRSWFLSLSTTRKGRFQVARIFRDTEFLLSRYVMTITAVNVALGIAVGAAMWAVEMPSPLLWGALAALVNFIPYLGMIFMTVVIAGVGLVSFDSFGSAILPALVYLGLNAIEGQVLTPMLLGKNLTLNPFVVFVSIAFWLWLWGPLGAFLAVPLVIIVSTTLYHLLPRTIESGAAPTFGKPAAKVPRTEPSNALT